MLKNGCLASFDCVCLLLVFIFEILWIGMAYFCANSIVPFSSLACRPRITCLCMALLGAQQERRSKAKFVHLLLCFSICSCCFGCRKKKRATTTDVEMLKGTVVANYKSEKWWTIQGKEKNELHE